MQLSPVILITGASSGIGEATARLFANKGYHAILAARRVERINQIATEINQSGGQALAIATDITRISDIEDLVSTSIAKFGRIDILVNNAGLGRLDWLENLDPIDDIESQIQTNLLGLIEMTRAVVPYMIARKRGHIINIGSLSGLIGTPTYSVYAASKFGIRGFSEALRRELHIWGIYVSVVYPGSVSNEFASKAGIHRKTGLSTPSRLKLTSEQVAQCIWGVVNRPRRMVILPRMMRVAVWLNYYFPAIVDWAIEKRFVKPERLMMIIK
jgi:hypothetical protein